MFWCLYGCMCRVCVGVWVGEGSFIGIIYRGGIGLGLGWVHTNGVGIIHIGLD